MSTRGSWLGVLALVLLAGCASHQVAPFPDQHVALEDPGHARIYVIRQPTFWRFNLVVLLKKIRVLDRSEEIYSGPGSGTMTVELKLAAAEEGRKELARSTPPD